MFLENSLIWKLLFDITYPQYPHQRVLGQTETGEPGIESGSFTWVTGTWLLKPSLAASGSALAAAGNKSGAGTETQVPTGRLATGPNTCLLCFCNVSPWSFADCVEWRLSLLHGAKCRCKFELASLWARLEWPEWEGKLVLGCPCAEGPQPGEITLQSCLKKKPKPKLGS